MDKRTVKLSTRQARQRAHALIDAAPEGYVCAIGEETRTDEQNRKMWPMIADMQRQIPAMTTYSANDIKLQFLDALGEEMRFLPKLEGAGLFPIGLRSSTLSKSQFSALITLMYVWGARHDVKWSDRSQATIADHVERMVA